MWSIPKPMRWGQKVSSTRLRQVLADANFVLASQLLGEPYQISGRVIHGRKLGRQLGVPTANLSLKDKQPALQGVYTVLLTGDDGVSRTGVANIGNRPTVDGVRPALEVHLFDFKGDLYGKESGLFSVVNCGMRFAFLMSVHYGHRLSRICRRPVVILRNRIWAVVSLFR